jgi:pyruvate/2-oxoglutarate dehydrogenase complex dihydrolipoamide acyltransferase (E2) component
VESPCKGVLTEIMATEGATILMTQPLGSITPD